MAGGGVVGSAPVGVGSGAGVGLASGCGAGVGAGAGSGLGAGAGVSFWTGATTLGRCSGGSSSGGGPKRQTAHTASGPISYTVVAALPRRIHSDARSITEIRTEIRIEILDTATLFSYLLNVGEARLHPVALPKAHWTQLLEAGRLVELTGHGHSVQTSTAVSYLAHVQSLGETAAWVMPKSPKRGSIFGPDLQACGIDLESLVVVRIPKRIGDHGPARAGELLLRSGAFGLVILDLSEVSPRFARDPAWQGRLTALARQHKARLLVLSPHAAHEPSLGPLVGVRLEFHRQSLGQGHYRLQPQLLKNKSGSALDLHDEQRRGPWGLS